MLERDRQAKVTMRRPGRGVRTIERRVLAARRRPAARASSPAPGPPQADETPRGALAEAVAPAAGGRSDLDAGQTAPPLATAAWAVTGAPDVEDEAGEVIGGYGAVVRGMVNDDQGGPRPPPGGRMSEA